MRVVHESCDKQIKDSYQRGYRDGYKAALELQPNDPLTLSELREMDGEPVWAMLRLPTNGIKGGWALVDTRNGYAAAQQRWTNWTLWYDEYGKTWVAYRRKPEEGTA